MEILAGAILLVVIYIAYKIHEANIRLVIMDLRTRVLEEIVANPTLRSSFDGNYEKIYRLYFEEREDYNAIVKFAWKHQLGLPLRTPNQKELKKALSDNKED